MATTQVQLREQVRRVIEAYGFARYRICQLMGFDQSILSEFVNGEIDLAMDSLDKLADLLESNIIASKAPAKGKAQRKGKLPKWQRHSSHDQGDSLGRGNRFPVS